MYSTLNIVALRRGLILFTSSEEILFNLRSKYVTSGLDFFLLIVLL